MDCFFIALKCRVCDFFRTFRFSRFLHVSFFKSSTFRFAGLICEPTQEEQIKIAALLQLIDERISTQNKIIEDLKKLKADIADTQSVI